jgi:hypothetical protein
MTLGLRAFIPNFLAIADQEQQKCCHQAVEHDSDSHGLLSFLGPLFPEFAALLTCKKDSALED